MDITLFVGLAAGFFTTISFIPQIIKIWKSKSADDVSRRMFLSVMLGLALWLVYGILEKAWPIILWNAVSLVLAGVILALKLRFG